MKSNGEAAAAAGEGRGCQLLEEHRPTPRRVRLTSAAAGKSDSRSQNQRDWDQIPAPDALVTWDRGGGAGAPVASPLICNSDGAMHGSIAPSPPPVSRGRVRRSDWLKTLPQGFPDGGHPEVRLAVLSISFISPGAEFRTSRRPGPQHPA